MSILDHVSPELLAYLRATAANPQGLFTMLTALADAAEDPVVIQGALLAWLCGLTSEPIEPVEGLMIEVWADIAQSPSN